MSTLFIFSKYISVNKKLLATEVVNGVIRKGKFNIPKWEEEQAIEMYEDLFRFLGKTLIDEDEKESPELLLEWSKKNSEMQVSSGGRLSEIINRYPPTKEVFNDILTGLSIDLGLSIRDHSYILKRIDKMLDASLNETFLWYKHLSDKQKEDTEKELLKLSAPIVPIQDGIVIVPLIGYIGMDNEKHIMENVIPKIAELEVDHVIADFSGSLTINEYISDLIRQIVRTLRLMGIHVVITGLRPNIVQTVIHSGIDLSNIESFATVKQAVENI
ncbi:STAS domain-containing protein [Oceanobacillus sp. CF4.6]|uniref:STAS domain-containing protein n=1 Tax=Oceanobacillus sp. CF4.6 TaxID=3373080 RepID=UPI003EE6D465